jgi:hypothetical protein
MKRTLCVLISGLLVTTLALAQISNFNQRGKAVNGLKGDGICIAHPSLPVNSKVMVVNTATGKEVEATVINRVSASPDRIAELSSGAWQALGLSPDNDIRIYTTPPPRPRPATASAPTATQNDISTPVGWPENNGFTPFTPATPSNQQPPNITINNYIPEQQQPEKQTPYGTPSVNSSTEFLAWLAAMDSRDSRDARDARDARDVRDSRDTRDARDARESRDYRIAAASPYAYQPPVVAQAAPVYQPQPQPPQVASYPVQPSAPVYQPQPVQPAYQPQQVTVYPQAQQPAPIYSPPSQQVTVYPPIQQPAPVYQPQPVQPVYQPQPVQPVYQPQPIQPAPQTQMGRLQIIPGLPDPNCGRTFMLQIGSFAMPEAAASTAQQARAYGFNVVYETYGNMYRVIVPNVPAATVYPTAQKLGAMGIQQIWIREQGR